MIPESPLAASRLAQLALEIKAWGRELGLAEVRITDTELAEAETGLQAWLQQGFHGEMDYMAAHGTKRTRPAELVPGTVRVIMARLDYLPDETAPDWRARERARLDDPAAAVVSVYARGRDYHKVLRGRLQQLASRIEAAVGPFGYRVFSDSAPVMEGALAAKAGLGWRGKHTLLLNQDAGSMFFLGEIYTDLPLPVDARGRGSLRQLQRLHRCLSDPGHPRALPAGCAALHLVPDDRTEGQHSGRACGR